MQEPVISHRSKRVNLLKQAQCDRANILFCILKICFYLKCMVSLVSLVNFLICAIVHEANTHVSGYNLKWCKVLKRF